MCFIWNGKGLIGFANDDEDNDDDNEMVPIVLVAAHAVPYLKLKVFGQIAGM